MFSTFPSRILAISLVLIGVILVIFTINSDIKNEIKKIFTSSAEKEELSQLSDNPQEQLLSEKNQVTIFFLGDSLTEGFGLKPQYSYPNQVEMLFRKENLPVKSINAGVSGDTSGGGLRRFLWYLDNGQEKIDILFLALGANDGLRGLEVSNMEDNLSKIITAAQKKNIKVVLSGMITPKNYGKEYVEAFRETFPKLAQKYNLPLLPFLLKDVSGKAQYNLPDQIHPNSDGYVIISENVFKILKPIVKEIHSKKNDR